MEALFESLVFVSWKYHVPHKGQLWNLQQAVTQVDLIFYDAYVMWMWYNEFIALF